MFKSATKLVFVMLALWATVGFFMDKISADQYIGLVWICFAFYYKGSTTTTDSDLSSNKPI